MQLGAINKFLRKFYADDSDQLFYELIKERDPEQYEKFVKGYPEEFFCFHADYAKYQQIILKDKLYEKASAILDIGCACGVQSEFFDLPYIGVEEDKMGEWFWDKKVIPGTLQRKNKYYDKTRFPDTNDLQHEIHGRIIISNMSLGFSSRTDNKEVAKLLSPANYIFISAPEALVTAIALEGGFNRQIISPAFKDRWRSTSGRYLLRRD